MNWLSDYSNTAGLVLYWGSIVLAIIAPLLILALIAVGIVKSATYMAPVNVRNRKVDTELRRMLDESR